MNTQLNILALRSSPKEEILLVEVNPFHSNTMISKRIPWNLQAKGLESSSKNAQNPNHALVRTVPHQIVSFPDGHVKIILKKGSSTNNLRKSISSRSENRSKNLYQFARFSTLSNKLKGVDCTLTIPKPNYISEKRK